MLFVSVPFSWGTVLHHGAGGFQLHPQREFQSPSRGGRCCIGLSAWISHRIQHVSVPFSWGTVLHPREGPRAAPPRSGFSPLLVGDGVASERWDGGGLGGTCFSPLLVGDGVASAPTTKPPECLASFSPLLVGDGVASRRVVEDAKGDDLVSVPFSWGTVLHPLSNGFGRFHNLEFQSPSRGGRCCIRQSETC